MAGQGHVESSHSILQSPISLDKYRQLVQSYIEKHLYQSALYWADKVVSISHGKGSDIYWLAQCLYHTRQYHRAAHCLISRKLDKNFTICRYLAAKCHFQAKEFQQALDVLNGFNHFNILVYKTDVGSNFQKNMCDLSESEGLPFGPSVTSSIHLLRGHLYEAMENRGLAVESFKEALKHDVHCYEAFESLVKHQMLTAQEEKELLNSLPFVEQAFIDEDDVENISLVKCLYENKLKKYDKPDTVEIPSALNKLKNNLDLAVNMAERHFYNCDYQECFLTTSKVLVIDPYHSDCLPLHIACLVELKKSNDLFYLAHRLVDLYPESAVSWFAVGSYYFLINKNENARRYLSKATTLDCVFGPAWLAYGHSFAVENEHDQAMAAYFKASQLMKGCHLPLLYIGLEYGLTHNSKLAERFFHQALAIAPEDPFVLHEMGVIAFQNEDWPTAEKYLKLAADKVKGIKQSVMPDKWEPLLNNLGHTYRKMKQYEESLNHHHQALVLCPQNASTLSAIGYVCSLMGKTAEAVDYFHKALSFRRDDMFSMTMLGQVIEQLIGEMSPCEGLSDDVPCYELPGEQTLNMPLIDHNFVVSNSNENPEKSESSLSIDVDMEGND